MGRRLSAHEQNVIHRYELTRGHAYLAHDTERDRRGSRSSSPSLGATGGAAKVHKVHKPYACAHVSSTEKLVGEPLADGFGQHPEEDGHTLRCPTSVAISYRSGTLIDTRIVAGEGGGWFEWRLIHEP
jgi:hypothetical protein